MKERTIYITEFDCKRLEALLASAEESGYRDRDDLENLEMELERGKIVTPSEVPPSVVTMNSRVRLVDVDSEEKMIYTLVFPQEADVEAGKLSVFSPIGTAILGYSEGGVVEWQVPSRVRRIKIDQVMYQPEAAGDYHL